MSGSNVGGALILIFQCALLVANYVFAWNLPWYLLFAPVLIPLALLGVFAVILLIAAIFAVVFGW